jgi:hypothetical protein
MSPSFEGVQKVQSTSLGLTNQRSGTTLVVFPGERTGLYEKEGMNP